MCRDGCNQIAVYNTVRVVLDSFGHGIWVSAMASLRTVIALLDSYSHDIWVSAVASLSACSFKKRLAARVWMLNRPHETYSQERGGSVLKWF